MHDSELVEQKMTATYFEPNIAVVRHTADKQPSLVYDVHFNRLVLIILSSSFVFNEGILAGMTRTRQTFVLVRAPPCFFILGCNLCAF